MTWSRWMTAVNNVDCLDCEKRGCSHNVPAVARAFAFACQAAFFMFAAAQALQAHDARPLSIVIVERTPHVYHADLLIPPSVDSINEPSVIWPEECRPARPPAVSAGEIRRIKHIMVCSGPIEGRRIGIRYALFNPSLSTLVRLTALD